jgi:hypothetical protein
MLMPGTQSGSEDSSREDEEKQGCNNYDRYYALALSF